jgi:hypothetical protein
MKGSLIIRELIAKKIVKEKRLEEIRAKSEKVASSPCTEDLPNNSRAFGISQKVVDRHWLYEDLLGIHPGWRHWVKSALFIKDALIWVVVILQFIRRPGWCAEMNQSINWDCSLDSDGNRYWMWNTAILLSHDFVTPLNCTVVTVIVGIRWVDFSFSVPKAKKVKIYNCVILTSLLVTLLTLEFLRAFLMID